MDTKDTAQAEDDARARMFDDMGGAKAEPDDGAEADAVEAEAKADATEPTKPDAPTADPAPEEPDATAEAPGAEAEPEQDWSAQPEWVRKAIKAGREGRKDAEKALADFRAEVEAERQAQQAESIRRQAEMDALRAMTASKPEAQAAPDPLSDPEAYQAYLQQEQRRMMSAQADQLHRQMAEVQHGPDAVKTAMDALTVAAQQQPWLRARFEHAANPYAEAVAWHAEQAPAQPSDDVRQQIIADYLAAQSAGAAPINTPPNVAGTPTGISRPAATTRGDTRAKLFGR